MLDVQAISFWGWDTMFLSTSPFSEQFRNGKKFRQNPNQLDFYLQVNSLQSPISGLPEWKQTIAVICPLAEGSRICEMALQKQFSLKGQGTRDCCFSDLICSYSLSSYWWQIQQLKCKLFPCCSFHPLDLNEVLEHLASFCSAIKLR